MLTQFVRVRNVSDLGQRIEDFQLPGGGLSLGVGEESSIPVAIYHRAWRRCHRWMRNLDAPSGVDVNAKCKMKNAKGKIGEA